MTANEEHLHQIERLIRQTTELLGLLREGQAPDLDAAAERRGEAFARLQSLGPLAVNTPLAGRCAERLRVLATLNDELAAALRLLLEETGDRLAQLQQGRRGIAGYKHSNAGGLPFGARRGSV